jgi:hemoglobin-like flavoprotein
MDDRIHTLRESFHRLIPKADLLAEHFYATLFARHPETLELFEGVEYEDQKRKLVRALTLLVSNMQRPDFLRAYLQGLGAIHVAYGVTPEAYPGFAECLLDALAATAGPAWSPEEAAAWRDALRLIIDAMLDGSARLTWGEAAETPRPSRFG